MSEADPKRESGTPSTPDGAPPAADAQAPAPRHDSGLAARARRATAAAVPLPAAPPVITATLSGELLKLIDPALKLQDLSADRLLAAAPRVQVDTTVVPALGGIPLFVKLGQGGQGRVYYGVHPETKAGVALKVVPLLSSKPDLVERYENKIEAALKVTSPHLVPISGMGEQNGLYFIVTQYIPGTSAAIYLHDVVAATKTGLPEVVALDLVLAVTRGLVEAHRNGIIHGDIKPENILVPRGQQPGQFEFSAAVLADLGLPRVEMLGGMLTGSNAAIGTPGYMAPEQAADEKAARKASDVFSLGATLYALLTGKTPFPSDNPMTAIMHTIQTPHEPVSSIRPEITPSTSKLVDTCLAKHHNGRYVDASALLEALSVCRAALDEPGVTQTSALKRITMVLHKSSEVGDHLANADFSTPTAIPFLAELAAAAQEAEQNAARQPAQKTAGPETVPARKSGTAAAVKGQPPRPVEPVSPPPLQAPAAAAPSEGGAAGGTAAQSGGNAIRIVALVAAVVLVGAGCAMVYRCATGDEEQRIPRRIPEAVAVGAAIAVLVTAGLLYVWRVTSSSLLLDTIAAHAVLLKSAREMLRTDPPAAGTLLQQARRLNINDPMWRAREQAVAALLAAHKLMQSGGDKAAIEKHLGNAAAVYPGDQTIEWLRDKIRDKPADSSAV